VLSLKYAQWLSQGKDFQAQAITASEEGSEIGKQSNSK
jgi:hypothetical protein